MTTKISEEHYKIAEQNGIDRENVYNRVNKLANPWSIEKAITTPVKRKGTSKHGKWLKIAHENGIYTELFQARLRLGWPEELASTEPIEKEGKKCVSSAKHE